MSRDGFSYLKRRIINSCIAKIFHVTSGVKLITGAFYFIFNLYIFKIFMGAFIAKKSVIAKGRLVLGICFFVQIKLLK